MYSVYMHTTPSGKRYVGITKQKVNQRWQNGNGYKKCTAFWRAIEKYGWDNITHEILETCEDLETANIREQYWISHYKTHNANYGYNCTDGGDGVKGWKATEEQKKKNSDAKKKNWQNEEFRKHLTEERRKRGSAQDEKERLRNMSIKNWQDKEMAEQLRNHLKEISQDEELKAKRKKKMHELWEENPKRFMENRKYKKGADNKRSKPIYCVELNKTFVNAREADKETGISYKQISACANGKRQSTHGYHFEFA